MLLCHSIIIVGGKGWTEMGPRKATDEEKRQLVGYHSAAAQRRVERTLSDVEASAIAVFDQGTLAAKGVGTRAKVMTVLWWGEPEFAEVFIWHGNRLQRFVPFN
jgi:hypothetical protein